MSAQFHQTRMGQRFFEHTMPELVRQLTRLNDLLVREGDAGVPVLRRFVATCVPRDGDDDWFVIDREDEEPAVLAGRGREGRRLAGQIARDLDDEHGGAG